MFSYTTFTFTALIFGERAKSVGRYCRQLHHVKLRAGPQETAIDEERIGLLIPDENVEEIKST